MEKRKGHAVHQEDQRSVEKITLLLFLLSVTLNCRCKKMVKVVDKWEISKMLKDVYEDL